MDYTVHGILQARILEWVAIPFSGDIPNPGIEPRSPALQADALPPEPPGKPSVVGTYNFKCIQTHSNDYTAQVNLSIDYRLWVMMCECNKYCNKCTTLVLDVDREGVCVCVCVCECVRKRNGNRQEGIYGNIVLCTQFLYKTRTALKINSILKYC